MVLLKKPLTKYETDQYFHEIRNKILMETLKIPPECLQLKHCGIGLIHENLKVKCTRNWLICFHSQNWENIKIISVKWIEDIKNNCFCLSNIRLFLKVRKSVFLKYDLNQHRLFLQSGVSLKGNCHHNIWRQFWDVDDYSSVIKTDHHTDLPLVTK